MMGEPMISPLFLSEVDENEDMTGTAADMAADEEDKSESSTNQTKQN